MREILQVMTNVVYTLISISILLCAYSFVKVSVQIVFKPCFPIEDQFHNFCL